jgi:hypothetical protein
MQLTRYRASRSEDFEDDGEQVEDDEEVCMRAEVHLPKERRAKIIMMACDLDVSVSFCPLVCAASVWKPSAWKEGYTS